MKLAYIFGSSVKEKKGKLGDIDIAVLLDERLSRRERSSLELDLISKLTSLLKTNSVDLVVMNDAPLLLNNNIIKGIPLKSDESVRIKMEANILSRYLDRKYHIQKHARETIKRIAGAGLR